MKRYYDDYGLYEAEEGDWVSFDEAKAEIDSRDKRLIALSIENRELQHKVAAQGARIAELEAQLAAERHLLVRYMAGVIDAEGESYIKNCRGCVVEFTESEKAALQVVEPLAIAEMNK